MVSRCVVTALLYLPHRILVGLAVVKRGVGRERAVGGAIGLDCAGRTPRWVWVSSNSGAYPTGNVDHCIVFAFSSSSFALVSALS